MTAVPPAGPVLRAEGLTRVFGERVAVRDVTLEAHRGRVLGVLGPNGSGKSTTVRLLTGLLEPTGGRIWAFGEPLTTANAAEVRGRMGIQTESNLYGRLTVEENLRLWGRLYGLSRAAVQRRTTEVLDVVGLADRRGSFVADLSKGLRQKAKIARALIAEPEILFLDEPTAGLDPEASVDVIAHLGQLRAEGRTAIVLCTHQLHGLEHLCDDLVVLDRGNLVAAGPVETLVQEHWPTRPYTIHVPDRETAEKVVAVMAESGVPIDAVRAQDPTLHDLYFRLLEGQR